MVEPLEIVVDGTDGAGKTPCVAHLCERFRRRGARVATYAPYRVEEVYPLWASDPELAARTIVTIMAGQRARAEADVIVWDRGWPTAFVSTESPEALALFRPLPPLTLLLLSTMERTRRQARKHPHAGVWATDEERVRRYNARYHALEATNAGVVLRFFPDADERFDLAAIGDAVERALDRAT